MGSSDLPAVLSEPLSAGIENITPSVSFVPAVFEIDGKRGVTNSWEEFENSDFYSIKPHNNYRSDC